MEQIPFLTNDTFAAAWWTPMTVYNGSTYIAFTSVTGKSGRHFLNVAKKTPDGKWHNHMLTRYDYVDDLGHNQTAIAVDGSGRIHVITSMHHDMWREENGHYYRSTSAENHTSWVNASTDLPGQSYLYLYTYPIMRRHPNGDLYLMARRFHSPSNAAPLIMYRWNNATSSWSSLGEITIIDADRMFLYPDDMQITSDGIVHFVFAHHSEAAGSRRHHPCYMRYNPADGTFRTADGVARTLPVHYSTPNLVYKGMVSGETITGDDPEPGHQSAALAITGGHPSIFYRHRLATGGFNRVLRARWNGAWAEEIIYDSSETSPAITHNITNQYIESFFCASTGGIYKLHRYRKSIATGEVELAVMSDIQLTRLYQEGDLLYASYNPQRYQYLIS